MTASTGFGARLARSPLAVWVAFVLVHIWLGMLNLYGPGFPFGDVTFVYEPWAQDALTNNHWVGINSPWVYPIVAIVPMLLSAMFGMPQYPGTWLCMVMVLNAVAFGVLTGWGRSRARLGAAWWWVAFLVLLGPIALGRIDSVSVPLAMVGVIVIVGYPRIATVLLTLATWIKVWPAALLLAAVVTSHQRKRIVAISALTSVIVIAIALLLGSGANVFSFVTEQATRGLQPEAPVSTFFMWKAYTQVDWSVVFYDQAILSYEVAGPGSDVALAVITPLLAVVVLAITLLGIRATRLGATMSEVFPVLALALTIALIAFNKVGSPQYIAWLAVPLVLGILNSAAGTGRSFRMPAILTLVIAALTQLVYPYFYKDVIFLNPVMLGVLTLRNVLEFVLLGWAIVALARAPRSEAEDGMARETDDASETAHARESIKE